jgi:histidine triad (HIT) family protein
MSINDTRPKIPPASDKGLDIALPWSRIIAPGGAQRARPVSRLDTMPQTVFEKIIAGELPCAKVYEDELVFAFMDAGQVNPGHVIVATRKPYETLLDADEASAAALFVAAWRIARAVDQAFAPAGITVLQANKPAGWQTVPHLHLHVLPRHAGDGVEVTWPRKNPPLETLRELAKRIGV